MSRLIFASILILCFAPDCIAQQDAEPRPPHADKCAVCGMFVSKYPDWACRISLISGATLWFDGPKDAFRFYLSPSDYRLHAKQEDIVSFTVKEYYGLSAINAKDAYFVIGSGLYGPMGRELVPFKTEAEAGEFIHDHGGSAVLRFIDITPEVLKDIDK